MVELIVYLQWKAFFEKFHLAFNDEIIEETARYACSIPDDFNAAGLSSEST